MNGVRIQNFSSATHWLQKKTLIVCVKKCMCPFQEKFVKQILENLFALWAYARKKVCEKSDVHGLSLNAQSGQLTEHLHKSVFRKSNYKSYIFLDIDISFW
jgi:adenylylsulfate kinase-like enzyme